MKILNWDNKLETNKPKISHIQSKGANHRNVTLINKI
jgi:hypothetical protein